MEIGIWIFKCSFGQIWFQDSNTTNVSEESQNNKNITTKHISYQLQLGWLNIWYLYTLLLILRDISEEQLVLFTVWPLLPAYTLEHKTYCLFIALMSQQMFKMSTIICYISKWAQACNTYTADVARLYPTTFGVLIVSFMNQWCFLTVNCINLCKKRIKPYKT